MDLTVITHKFTRYARIAVAGADRLVKRCREGTVPRTVFLARHAGLRFGGMGTVSDDI